MPETPLEDLYRARDLLQSAAASVRAIPLVERGHLRPYDMAITGVVDAVFAVADELAKGDTDAVSARRVEPVGDVASPDDPVEEPPGRRRPGGW